MISAEAPVLFAKACEMFILELSLRAWYHTEENKRRTLQRSDIATAISKSDVFDFLIDIVPRDDVKPAKKVQSCHGWIGVDVNQGLTYITHIGTGGSASHLPATIAATTSGHASTTSSTTSTVGQCSWCTMAKPAIATTNVATVPTTHASHARWYGCLDTVGWRCQCKCCSRCERIVCRPAQPWSTKRRCVSSMMAVDLSSCPLFSLVTGDREHV